MPTSGSWVLPSSDTVDARDALRRVLEQRIAASESTPEVFLRPTTEHLHDPAGIAGMDEACERVLRSIRDGEQILIYGDYDVDGVTSIVLLTRVISLLGGRVRHVVPHRLFDGYGLKSEVLDRVLVQENVKLVITVDCGITSVEPVARALEQGIDVIITDHHLPPEMLPEAVAVLNPKKPGCTYPYKELAGVGVAFKLSCELMKRGARRISTESLLKIAALGTIADVAPLTGENRTIARIGLNGLATSPNRGLRALLLDLGLFGRPLRASDVGFRIGPRINAAGRLASADTAIRLFSAETDEEARGLVAELNRLNAERQSVERQILALIDERLAAAEKPNVIAVSGEGWHKGVLGLCAGRVAQKYHRPTLVVTIGETECVGSGRSSGDFDLHGFLSGFASLFRHFGGHEFACGFSFRRDRLADFERVVAEAGAAFDASMFERRYSIDASVSFTTLDAEVLRLHDDLEPFGAANRQPMLHTRGVRAVSSREFSPGCFNVTLENDGAQHVTTLWRPEPELKRMLVDEPQAVDLIYTITPDRYGRFGFRLDIVDCATDAQAREACARLARSREEAATASRNETRSTAVEST